MKSANRGEPGTETRPRPDRDLRRRWLDRPPPMPLFFIVSILIHLNLLIWVGMAQGRPATPREQSLTMTFGAEPETPEASPQAQPVEPEEPEEDHFVDVPEEKPDEGPPLVPTAHIGIRDLRARDPKGVPTEGDTPAAKGNTEAPVIEPGGPAAPNPLWPRTHLPFEPALPETGAPAAEAPADAPEAVEPFREPAAPDVPIREDAIQVAPPAKTSTGSAQKSAERKAKTRDIKPVVTRIPGTQYMFTMPTGPAWVQRNPGGGATAKGPTQYNVKYHEYASYYKHLSDRIRLAFAVRSRTHYRSLYQLKRPRIITTGFRVTRKGKFMDLHVLEDAGLVLIASDLLDVLKTASPADPFPDFVKEHELSIRVRWYVE